MKGATRVHRLKTWPALFTDVVTERKTFEVRENDREFQVGDVLILEEWVPEPGFYTGSFAVRKVTYLLPGGAFGIAEGTVVMGIVPHAMTDGIEQRTSEAKK